MDRKPLPAPFPVGTRLRYVGADETYVQAPDGTNIPVKVPGVEVEVAKVTTGRRGTLNPLPGEWDDDDPPLDTTQDGYSVFYVDVPGRKPFGRIIWPAWAGEWEVVR